MILTESDLHAYNRGELPVEAVRQLEEDPLALQDAARLRTISEALRQEAPIPVTGRAETLERLRRKSAPRVGVSGWVWAAGAVCVFGLVLISLPHEAKPEYAVREASYTPTASAPAAEEEFSSDARSRGLDGGNEEGSASGALLAPLQPQRARPQAAESQVAEASAVGGVDIARTASLDLRVDDVAATKASAEAAAKRLGGFVADGSLTRLDERPVATLKLRVPSSKLETLITEVRRLGSLAAESSASEDVTAERVDSEARLTTMLAEERQLRELMNRATNVNEVLRVRERLTEVRSAIESLRATLKTLKGRVQMATLNVTLVQRPKAGAAALEDGWPHDSMGGAVNSLRTVGRRLATSAIYIGVFSPLWLPLLVVGFLRFRRR